MSDQDTLPPRLAEMQATLASMAETHRKTIEAAYIYAVTYRSMLDVYVGELTVALANAEREIAAAAAQGDAVTGEEGDEETGEEQP